MKPVIWVWLEGFLLLFFFFLNFQWTKWKTTFDNKSSFLRVSLIPFLWVQGCNAILLAKKQQRKKNNIEDPHGTRNETNRHTWYFQKSCFFFSSCTSALSLPEPLYKGQWEASLQQAPQNTAGRDVAGQCWGTELAPQGMRPTQELWPTGQPWEKRAENPSLREDNACTQPNESKRHHTQPSHT